MPQLKHMQDYNMIYQYSAILPPALHRTAQPLARLAVPLLPGRENRVTWRRGGKRVGPPPTLGIKWYRLTVPLAASTTPVHGPSLGNPGLVSVRLGGSHQQPGGGQRHRHVIQPTCGGLLTDLPLYPSAWNAETPQ